MQRELLQNHRTWHVQKGGDDANDGSALAPFATIQHGVDHISKKFDCGGYLVELAIGLGTWDENVELKTVVGRGHPSPRITGDLSNPSNVVSSVSSGNNFTSDYFDAWRVRGLKIENSGLGAGLMANVGGIKWGLIEFGEFAGVAVRGQLNSFLRAKEPCTISGNMKRFLELSSGTVFYGLAHSLELINSPSFSREFVLAQGCSYVHINGLSHTGPASGRKFVVSENSVIQTASGSHPDFFPGDIQGVEITGGVYL